MSAVYTWRVHAWATSQLCSNFRRDLSYVFSVAPTILVVSFEQLDKLSWTQNFISHKLLYNRHDVFWFFLDRMCIVSVTAFVVKLYSFFASHLNINKYKRFSSFVRRRRMRGDSTMLLQGTPVFFFFNAIEAWMFRRWIVNQGIELRSCSMTLRWVKNKINMQVRINLSLQIRGTLFAYIFFC